MVDGGLKRIARAALPLALLFSFLSIAPSLATVSPRAFQFALPNGMQVVVIPDHRAPVVTEMVWFRVGAADDPPGLGGLAHFFEHMMFRGTKQTPGDEYAQTIERNGGESNAFTTHDYTAFYEQIAKDRLKIAMALEADRIANLDLSDANVNTERDVVLEERRMRIENNPQTLLEEQMGAALYLTHPYSRPVIGWTDEVRRIGRAEAQAFYDHHYSPNNAILVIAGDVTPDEVRADAKDTLAKVLPRTRVPRYEFAQPPRLGETRLMLANKGVKVPYFARMYRVKSYAEAGPGEAESLDLLAQLLGGDETGALYRTLVLDRKLATDAGASYDGMDRDAGEFDVYAVPRPGVSLDQLERAVDQVLGRYLGAQPKPDELTRAKTQLVATTIYRRDSQYALATAYGEALVIGLTLDDVDAWPSRIRAIGGDGVQRAAREALDKRESVTGYLVPQASK
jgi:zinc protease